MNVGIIGFSGKKFDSEKATSIIKKEFDKLYSIHGPYINIVSGYTDLGIPAIAYREARKVGFHTVGVACKKANEYTTYPCDSVYIHGDNWGDESKIFLDMLDILIRVGGGSQSFKEVELAKEKNIEIIEYDLEEIK